MMSKYALESMLNFVIIIILAGIERYIQNWQQNSNII